LSQRQILILLGALLLAVFVILPLVTRSGDSGPSSAEKAARTREAVNLIDRAERRYLAQHGRYTSHLADLLPRSPRLVHDLAIVLDVEIDVGSDGRSYVASVRSDVLSFVLARSGEKVVAQSCLVLKRRSGVACP